MSKELESKSDLDPDLQLIKYAHAEFLSVLERSTVIVVQPNDKQLLARIHRTIEYVIREGPAFESVLIARESKNLDYSFLCDYQSQNHVYYRWKLYSILHGDDAYNWPVEEFRMFRGGPIWRPPPVNPYAAGMPKDLVDSLTKNLGKTDNNQPTSHGKEFVPKKSSFQESLMNYGDPDDVGRVKGSLGKLKREMLGDLLRNLDPTKDKIGAAMLFCINHADAAKEIIDSIYESLLLLETPLQKKIARMFLVSDVLNNCSAAVTNASYYREGFQLKLVSIFEHLRDYLINMEDRYKADRFKQKMLSILGAWKEWTLYENNFVIKLSNILLGLSTKPTDDQKEIKSISENDLDGTPLDDEILKKCLEDKGLSLNWYESLDLSEDETETEANITNDTQGSSGIDALPKSPTIKDPSKFRTSKWETVDPNEVAEQVITLSKWESIAKAEEEGETDSESELDQAGENEEQQANKKVKLSE